MRNKVVEKGESQNIGKLLIYKIKYNFWGHLEKEGWYN